MGTLFTGVIQTKKLKSTFWLGENELPHTHLKNGTYCNIQHTIKPMLLLHNMYIHGLILTFVVESSGAHKHLIPAIIKTSAPKKSLAVSVFGRPVRASVDRLYWGQRSLARGALGG